VAVAATLRHVEAVEVPAPVEGRLTAVHKQAGDDVFEGELIAEIKSDTAEANRQVAAAALEKARVRVEALEGAVAAAQLEASRAAADAMRARMEADQSQRQYSRQKAMIAAGATPRRVFEKAESDFNAAQAEAKSMTELAAAADERVSSTVKELDAARKILDELTHDLEDAEAGAAAGVVLSPVTGTVVTRGAEQGDLVHPANQALFHIATDLSQLQAVASLSPEQRGRVHAGQTAEVAAAESGDVQHGTVESVENGEVTISFPNPDLRLRPGTEVQLRIRVR
jgi:multidrug resistance efflux pump